jgi:hypothetical protein
MNALHQSTTPIMKKSMCVSILTKPHFVIPPKFLSSRAKRGMTTRSSPRWSVRLIRIRRWLQPSHKVPRSNPGVSRRSPRSVPVTPNREEHGHIKKRLSKQFIHDPDVFTSLDDQETKQRRRKKPQARATLDVG